MFVLYAQDYPNDGYHYLQKYDQDEFQLLYYDLAFVKKIGCASIAFREFLSNVLVSLITDHRYQDEDLIVEYLEDKNGGGDS